ncbi:DUF6359 domain-containing protein [Streptococcus plurextorum]|uniref:DUF6359 domain-containing protein n=1 Tax=Streptococcus plurextorum TaxID=456876 RepID=UPI0004090C92
MKTSYSKIIRKSITVLATLALLSANSGHLVHAISVPDYSIIATPTKAEVTVEGYITGSLNTSGSAYATVNTNLALGATPTAAAKDTIPVQLPSGAIRSSFNIVDNPSLIGKYVRITGTSESYFGRIGIKSTKEITVIDTTTETTSTTSTTSSETTAVTPPIITTPTNTTAIATVRQGQVGSSYTVYGKIISAVSGWGGNGFYIQDDSGAGLYVYPGSNNPLGYKIGDVVQLTGTLSTYNNELQLATITNHQLLNTPVATGTTETTIPTIASAPSATLVKLNNLTAGTINSDHFNNSTFTATDSDGNTISVKLDSRTGFKTADLLTIIDKGDVINLTGILAGTTATPQIRPFDLSHFEVVTKAKPDSGVSETLTVSQIQGENHKSPYENRKVTTKDVVVTYIAANNNFYVQDLTADGNPNTSDGINIYSGQLGTSVAVGDVLTITGTVEERIGRGYDERFTTDLATTQIVASQIDKTDTADVPAPVLLGTDRVFPSNIIDNDGFATFDPSEDAIDFWESLEGMVVAIDDAKVIGPMKNKEIYVLSGNSTTPTNNVGGVSLRPDGNNTDIIPIQLKSGSGTYKSGDYFTGRIYGPVTYSYTNYKVYVDDKTLPTFTDGGITPEKTSLVKSPDKLSIASYNIENFSANTSSTSDAKVQRIAQSFVNDLNSPDIIGLVEVQDNDGATDSGNTDATQSANRLIQAIAAAGGPTYTYIDIAPENNQDGGAAGGNIRLGYLYNPDRVSLSNKPKGSATDAVSWTADGLSHSVGRINPTNPAWQSVRKTLAAEFVFNGEKVVVLANHLNSKRGDYGLYGSIQPVTFGSESKRHALAQIIADFTAQNPDANIVMLGDFNDYEFTKTIQILETGGMTNLVSRHDAADRFSYFYNGNNQSLDNMLVSNNLLNSYEFDMVHVNSAFMEQHGRASDHDPLLLQLSLAAAPEQSSSETSSESSQTRSQVTNPETSSSETSASETSSTATTETTTEAGNTTTTESSSASTEASETSSATTTASTETTPSSSTTSPSTSTSTSSKQALENGSTSQSQQTISQTTTTSQTKKTSTKKGLPKTGDAETLVLIGLGSMIIVLTGLLAFRPKKR